MTKKELEAKVRQLENMVELLQELLEVYRTPTPAINKETCPMGGEHCYNYNDTAGWHCKCGKRSPIYDVHPYTT